jgi:predicted esterase
MTRHKHSRLRQILLLGCLPSITLLLLSSDSYAQRKGQPALISQCPITEPTRLDWIFAVSNQSPAEAPAGLLENYDSTKQRFELYVPAGAGSRAAAPLILFISPSQKATGLSQFRKLCDREGIVFASPHQAGNKTPGTRRVRIVMDTLDEVRRRVKIDPDRTYIGGFSGGGRIAMTIATALPEYFGGVIPVCAGGRLRTELWLRERVMSRLRIALLTGENDFNRGEIERMTQTLFSGIGVTSRVWTAKRIGHAIPSGKTLDDAFAWLEDGLNDRQALARRFPASRISGVPSRSEWARQLFAEAELRLESEELFYSGLTQLMGIRVRWNDLPESDKALVILKKLDAADDRPWEAVDVASQRRYLIAQARAVDAYASGPLPKQYHDQKVSMLHAAIRFWSQVVADGQDKDAVAEGTRRIPILKSILDSE